MRICIPATVLKVRVCWYQLDLLSAVLAAIQYQVISATSYVHATQSLGLTLERVVPCQRDTVFQRMAASIIVMAASVSIADPRITDELCRGRVPLPSYACDMRCPLLTYVVLRYMMSGTDLSRRTHALCDVWY